MTQAIMTLGRAVNGIEAKSLNASRGVRLAIGFGIVAASYAAVIIEGLHGLSFAGLS
ncbi:hypothetical protein M0D69_08680 [Caballeronia sp. SEWSISQ10-4 2]|uniref:hypothetical protein n=1 Tax=Caballeronia sp. SEWSISQ10-4 2 TaxID=2937438 RepID=UPI00264A65A5|nr:hypothetical protein [Caballeronia sp. SEWSISQ10-4 2]MDN7178091.1 hypothetical protein [Caballeronia sp. SEWSISQ10-4 2]